VTRATEDLRDVDVPRAICVRPCCWFAPLVRNVRLYHGRVVVLPIALLVRLVRDVRLCYDLVMAIAVRPPCSRVDEMVIYARLEVDVPKSIDFLCSEVDAKMSYDASLLIGIEDRHYFQTVVLASVPQLHVVVHALMRIEARLLCPLVEAMVIYARLHADELKAIQVHLCCVVSMSTEFHLYYGLWASLPVVVSGPRL
jgi:hypothetical protein